MPITRQVKNVVKNYSNVEVKVREATSNDPWGPSSSLMADIADQTYNVVAFSEIMTMIWKRLNDHGKNWRHVYKSLVLLDYILKTGSERVAHQCRENIFAIQTLKDFQFIDRDGKDQGMNVREKSKQLVALLKDDERLKNERTRALKAKERLTQSLGPGGVGRKQIVGGSSLRESGSASDVRVERASEASEPTSRSWEPERRTYNPSEIEKCRPSNTNEEELQLQLALALSKQEADETQHNMAKDEQRFQMAVTESRHSVKKPPQDSLLNIAGSGAARPNPWGTSSSTAQALPHASDPWGHQPSDPWGGPSSGTAPPTVQPDPWLVTGNQPLQNPTWSPLGASPPSDPWGTSELQPAPDPWAGSSGTSMPPPQSVDPWGTTIIQEPWNQPSIATTSADLFSTPVDPWLGPDQATSNGGSMVPEPFDMSSVGQSLLQDNTPRQNDLLVDHSTLVNLDSLVGSDTQSNPFFNPAPQPTKPGNPFAHEKPVAPSLNQLRTNVPQPVQPNQNMFGDPLLPAPLIPAGTSSGTANAPNNPFL